MLNYDDYIWEKYHIGEWLKVTDPANRKPTVKNLFYNSKIGLKPVGRQRSGRPEFHLLGHEHRSPAIERRRSF